ncbi:MAG: leucine--tRNA ligase [Candidatus Micrarchaeota archaeon]
MNFQEIDSKWNKAWQEKKCFEADPQSGKEKKFITAAFPYPNSPQHIGHGRTYTTTDVYARYMRLKGYNVLLPMAFHVTGTPIIAMAQRLAERDKELLKIFSDIYGIPEATAKKLTDPNELVLYFSREIEAGMKEIGYSIDWRRKFYSFDARFNKFIQWQFRKLKAAGYLVEGEYPIAWCPNDRQAVSAHDTKGDVDPDLEHVAAVKFEVPGKNFSFVATTYRPETIYGVTNLWINPAVKYVLVRIGKENFVMAKDAAETLSFQLELEIEKDIPVEELLNHNAFNSVTNEKLPIYPASFVQSDIGTGVVMSVPAHAPYDYLALRDLGKGNIKMPQVISVEGYGALPAKEVVEKLQVKDQDDEKAEEATKEIYKKEAHEGKMAVGKYKGMLAKDAKDKIADDLVAAKEAFRVYTIANSPVNCRCGEKVVVNILKNQWFIDYGNEQWKEKTRKCLADMNILPEDTRAALMATVEWLKTKPCTRAKGLGTKFPFDESKLIEALSDSTIYMSYYTIAHQLSKMDEKEVSDELFDYVLLGKGKGKPEWKQMRESFSYWYPLDSRHSGADLLRNHLTLFIFNHTAIFPEESWPKQIVTNGFVLMDGMKMSKSMGNILPLRKAVAEYGADVIRFSAVCGADLLHDTDFNKTVAEGIRSRLLYMNDLLQRADERKQLKPIDKWLLSRLNRRLKKAQELYEIVDLRGVSMELLYDLFNDMKWYTKRTDKYNLSEFFEKWTIAISPFAPHVAEEFWQQLGKKGMVVQQHYPAVAAADIDDTLEKAEEFVKQTLEDMERILSLVAGKMETKPQKITLYVADDWKRRFYAVAKEQKDIGKIMAAAKTDTILAPHMKDIASMAKQIMKNVHSLPDVLESAVEYDALKDAAAFYTAETGCKVEVLKESEAKHEKAKNAMPNKPAIVIE